MHRNDFLTHDCKRATVPVALPDDMDPIGVAYTDATIGPWSSSSKNGKRQVTFKGHVVLTVALDDGGMADHVTYWANTIDKMVMQGVARPDCVDVAMFLGRVSEALQH